jgi:glutaredoxin
LRNGLLSKIKNQTYRPIFDIFAGEEDNLNMIKKVGIYLIFLTFLFVLFVANSNADIYSWTDKDGVAHISSTPPQGDTNLKVDVLTDTWIKTNYIPPVIKTPATTPVAAKLPKKPQVELYVTSWCGWCKKAEAFFRSKRVDLIIYDVEKDKKAAQRKDKLDKKRGIPFAVINGKYYIHGYDEKAYNNALKQ